HTAVARDQIVPKRRDLTVPGEDVDVFAFDAHATVLRDEAAVVRRVARGITRDAVVFRDVYRGVERDEIAVDGDRHERRDGSTGRATTPRVGLGVEFIEANVLARARAQLGAFTVALGEADGAAAGQGAAALNAQRFVKRARHAFDRLAARILERNRLAAEIRLAGEVVVGVAKGAQDSSAGRARVEPHGGRRDRRGRARRSRARRRRDEAVVAGRSVAEHSGLNARRR